MKKLELDAQTDETGALRIRLPGPPASYRVHVTLEWHDAEAPAAETRRAVFDAIRAHGHPAAQALLAQLGEEAIVNPEALLSYGLTSDAPIERPAELPLESRDGL